MGKKIQIAPSILSADFSRLGEEIRAVDKAGCDIIHIDVMDGHFVPNITIGPLVVEAARTATSKDLDVHLMIETPGNLVEAFVKAGADRLTIHAEAVDDLSGELQKISGLGVKASVAISPDTPAEAIESVLNLVDMVLVMTVYPGFSGQAFIPEMLPKIQQVRAMLNRINPEAAIQVDGGINVSTLPQVLAAGANIFVAASAIYKQSLGIDAGIMELREQLD